MEQHDAWFFVGIFVFIFLIWVSTGGPLHPLSFAGPALAQPEELGGGTYLGLPRANFKIGSRNVSLPGSSNGGSTYSYTNTRTYDGSPAHIPAPVFGIYFGPPSPYINQVSMTHYVSNASSTDEYVELSVVQNSSNSVKITGWTIESEATYNAEIIPKGTRVPTSGVVNASEDIVLEPGDRAIISTGPSPVGASFRENKCTGYFGTMQKFSPTLPLACPLASSELLNYYGTPYIHDPACIDFVQNLPRCKIPLDNPGNLNDTCESFLVDKLNYNGCVTTHRSDADFAGTTWHIYLDRTDRKGKTKPMWRTKHEVVKLLDERGKTVAQFTY
jgi:hypothetical protein